MSERLLLFPLDSVEALAQPLSNLLTPMLRPSAYHEAFMFRGFYLTGRTDAGAEAMPDAFTARLFSERIFPEHVLAQPVGGARSRRRRQIRIAQVVLAVGLVLSVVGVAGVRGRHDAIRTVTPLVEEIASLGSRFRAVKASMQAPDGRSAAQALAEQIDATETKRLLMLMSGISVDQLKTAWAPLSYTTDADATLERAIRAAYEVAVLREVRYRLTDQIPALLGADESAVAPASGPNRDADAPCAADGATVADIDRFQQITKRLGDYSQQLQFYQSLTENPQIGTLKSLLEFALAIELPAGFSGPHNLY